MKDFAEFAALAESPKGRDTALEGVPELFDPRRTNLNDIEGKTNFAVALHDASMQSTLNLLRMYHEWLSGASSE